MAYTNQNIYITYCKVVFAFGIFFQSYTFPCRSLLISTIILNDALQLTCCTVCLCTVQPD